ncbi:hypothetical protein KL928_005428, partial [Ogataea angusta]
KVKDGVRIVFDEQARKEHASTSFTHHPQASLRSCFKQTLLSLECLEDNSWLAKTPRGYVHAKKDVAANAYTRALSPDFWGKIKVVSQNKIKLLRPIW